MILSWAASFDALVVFDGSLLVGIEVSDIAMLGCRDREEIMIYQFDLQEKLHM